MAGALIVNPVLRRMAAVLQNFIHNKELVVFLLAMLPISELRGAIPVGLALGVPLYKVLIISILGNSAIIIPALLLFVPVSQRLRRFKPCKGFFDWFFERTKKKADIIQKYEALGLAIFVGIPLPMTGAWSGCVAATMFKMKFRYALAANAAGVLIAAAIVTAVCLFGKGVFLIFIKQ